MADWPIESNLIEHDVELGARPACAEMLRGGVTTSADDYFSMNASLIDRSHGRRIQDYDV